MEESDMNTLRSVVACAAALIACSAWADDATATSQTEPPTQDTGGVTPGMQAGANQALTRDQVYQDFLRAQQSGQIKRLQQDLYHGS
jgi:hypothetical protein